MRRTVWSNQVIAALLLVRVEQRVQLVDVLGARLLQCMVMRHEFEDGGWRRTVR